MSSIEKAAQAITQSKGFQSALPFGTPEQVQERHAGLIAQALADAGLLASEGADDGPCLCDVGVQECAAHPGRLLTQDQRIEFRKTWDAAVRRAAR